MFTLLYFIWSAGDFSWLWVAVAFCIDAVLANCLPTVERDYEAEKREDERSVKWY